MTQNTSHAVMAQRVEAPRTRTEALALGVKWWIPEIPCPRGHIAKRNVSNYECRQCVKEKCQRERALGSPKWKRKDAERYARDPEASNVKSRRSRKKHIEKRRAYDNARYHNNDERKAWQKAQAKEWARLNKGKRNAITARRRAWIKQATPRWLSCDQRALIRLHYLIAADLPGEWHVDHIVPLRGRNVCGLNVPWNLQLLPRVDNAAKGNRFAE